MEEEPEQQGDINDDDLPTLGKARATVRFYTGSVPWRENMYQRQRLGRMTNEEYKAKRRQHWHDNKDRFLQQRKDARQAAREAMGALVKKVGRPPVPDAAKMVEKELAAPLNIEQMVFLGSPDVFGNIQKKIVIPQDLVNYLRLPKLYIDDRPLRWPMFKFSSWSELEPSTRTSYVSSARNALVRSDYKVTEEQVAAFQRHMYYDSSLDKPFLPQDEEEEDVAEDAETLAKVDADVANAAFLNAAGDADKEKAAVEVAAKKKARRINKGGKYPFSQNPLRVVDFMEAVDIDPWQEVRKTYETTQANGFASGLAGVTYAKLRYLYERGDYKGAQFRKLLEWSFIFSRYTSVARKDTGDRHASQLTTPEKKANTEDWDVWEKLAMERLRHYFLIKGDKVEIRDAINPKLPNKHGPRPKYQILNNGQKNIYVPEDSTQPPWQQQGYSTELRRPNLRELRDCALLACYSLIAPIRLDWATVEVMTGEQFKKFKRARDDALAPADAEVMEGDGGNEGQGAATIDIGEAIKAKDKKRKEINKNVIVVDYAEVKEVKKKRGGGETVAVKYGAPIDVSVAYFSKMKNKSKFKDLPVPKYVRKESPLCANILLAYLQERHRQGFVSHCLFPANLTPKSEDLSTSDCYTNSAFGGHLADMAWSLTGKNFTETLMRRSFITWFWEQPKNDPLNQATWDALLPRVHQTSSSTNLGYIKKRSAELEKWLELNKDATPQQKLEQVRLIRAAALADTGQDNPEVDELEIQQQQKDKEAIQLAKKEVEEVLLHRRSRRLAGKDVEEEEADEVVPPPPPPPPAAAAAAVKAAAKAKAEAEKAAAAAAKAAAQAALDAAKAKAEALKALVKPPPPPAKAKALTKKKLAAAAGVQPPQPVPVAPPAVFVSKSGRVIKGKRREE